MLHGFLYGYQISPHDQAHHDFQRWIPGLVWSKVRNVQKPQNSTKSNIGTQIRSNFTIVKAWKPHTALRAPFQTVRIFYYACYKSTSIPGLCFCCQTKIKISTNIILLDFQKSWKNFEHTGITINLDNLDWTDTYGRPTYNLLDTVIDFGLVTSSFKILNFFLL